MWSVGVGWELRLPSVEVQLQPLHHHHLASNAVGEEQPCRGGWEWVRFSDITRLALAMCLALTWHEGREGNGGLYEERRGEERITAQYHILNGN